VTGIVAISGRGRRSSATSVTHAGARRMSTSTAGAGYDAAAQHMPRSPTASAAPQNPYRELRFEQFPESRDRRGCRPPPQLPHLPFVAMPPANVAATALAVTVAAATAAEALATQFTASLSACASTRSPQRGSYSAGRDDDGAPARGRGAQRHGGHCSGGARAGRRARGAGDGAAHDPRARHHLPRQRAQQGAPAMLDVPGAVAKRTRLNSPRSRRRRAGHGAQGCAGPCEAKRIAQVRARRGACVCVRTCACRVV